MLSLFTTSCKKRKIKRCNCWQQSFGTWKIRPIFKKIKPRRREGEKHVYGKQRTNIKNLGVRMFLCVYSEFIPCPGVSYPM